MRQFLSLVRGGADAAQPRREAAVRNSSLAPGSLDQKVADIAILPQDRLDRICATPRLRGRTVPGRSTRIPSIASHEVSPNSETLASSDDWTKIVEWFASEQRGFIDADRRLRFRFLAFELQDLCGNGFMGKTRRAVRYSESENRRTPIEIKADVEEVQEARSFILVFPLYGRSYGDSISYPSYLKVVVVGSVWHEHAYSGATQQFDSKCS